MFTCTDKNPWAVMISNYKYFSEFLWLQPCSLCAMEGRLCSLIMTLYMTKCKRLRESSQTLPLA